jgi:hypothetical protein
MEATLALPVDQRINGILLSVNQVHAALRRVASSIETRDLQERIELFTATPATAIRR